MKNLILTITLFTTVFLSQAQNDKQYLGIGQWQEYLSYNKAVSVAVCGGRIYCATKSGIFWLNRMDNSMYHLSKLNGLSDIEAVKIRYNTKLDKTLLVYKNTNLDIIQKDGAILNIPDIKNKSLFGNKAINNVFMEDHYAYLACGFGIVVLDMEKEEIKESYNMDPMGNAINVRDIILDDLYIYASTDNGVYQALRTDNLAIYSSWKKMNGLPNGVYNAIASVNGKLYANLSKAIMQGTYNQDEIYVFENGSWSLFSKMPSFGFDGRALKNSYGKLLITAAAMVLVYDNVQDKMMIANTVNGIANMDSYESDMDDGMNIWIADQNFGLVKNMYFNGTESFYPSGPASANVNAMCFGGDDALWVVPGGLNAANGNTNTRDGVSILYNNDWTVLSGKQNNINFDAIYDIVNVIVDPVNPKRAYASSFSKGVIEFYDKKPAKIHNLSNSTLLAIIPGDTNYVWTYGMAFDKDNNLWVGNCGVETPLAVKLANGTWKSLNFAPLLGKPYVFQVLIDKSDQKWFVIPGGGGVVVYKGGVNDTPNNSNTKLMTVAVGSGHLPSPAVYCLAEDNEGEIWVGTDKGVCVFYNPGSIFTGQNFDAQTIKLEQDGNI
ncbi:MAG TPA: two-component regulator propeller domain-containing protein, partial [Chitinophagales bacterium]|nr:two-component regulator propeller domain-containing protein [Chitinophagales bacterium]